MGEWRYNSRIFNLGFAVSQEPGWLLI